MVVVLAILPIFGLITLGYLFGWRQWLNNEGAAGLAGSAVYRDRPRRAE